MTPRYTPWISRMAHLGSVCLLALCAAGCSYFNPYQQIKPHMLDNPNGKFCWAPLGSPPAAGKNRCANAKARPSLDRCIAKLARTSHWYTPVEGIDLNVLNCMEAEGWERALYEGIYAVLG